MTIYLVTRLAVWLVGLDWPIPANEHGNPMACLAIISAAFMPFEIIGLGYLVTTAYAIGRKKHQ